MLPRWTTDRNENAIMGLTCRRSSSAQAPGSPHDYRVTQALC